MIRKLMGWVRHRLWLRSLPQRAKQIRRADARGLHNPDPGIDATLAAAADWLCAAQDQSTTHDGGVARHFSLAKEQWGASYPETTGYIVPTMLALSRVLDRSDLKERARRMLDWFVQIQMPGGGFQGGMVNMTPKRAVTFNTGQILIGLAAGVAELGTPAYREAMRQAADWLVETQDPDGCWRRAPTPFAAPGEKAYETHVSWGLLEAARVQPTSAWENAAFRNIDWATARQSPNGWVRDCCLDDPSAPLTHTLGYYLRGVIEGNRFRSDANLLAKASTLGRALLRAQRPDGSLPGRLRADWQPAVQWVCLTGLVQISASWIDLFELTGEAAYRDAALRANSFVRRTVVVQGPPEIRGGLQGSFPVDGDYGTFQYLNWACKFMVDACLAEQRIITRGQDLARDRATA